MKNLFALFTIISALSLSIFTPAFADSHGAAKTETKAESTTNKAKAADDKKTEMKKADDGEEPECD